MMSVIVTQLASAERALHVDHNSTGQLIFGTKDWDKQDFMADSSASIRG
jgi:hypothetical protein